MIDPFDLFSIAASLNGIASLIGGTVQWQRWKKFEDSCVVTQGVVVELKRGRVEVGKLWIHPMVRFPIDDASAEPRRFSWSTNPPRWLVDQTVEVRYPPNAPDEFFLDRCHLQRWLAIGLLANAAGSLIVGIGSAIAYRWMATG